MFNLQSCILWKERHQQDITGLNWITRQTEEMGENDVCSFPWHLSMNVIMCKYLQAPNRNAGNLRSLCITLWEYMFRCSEIKLRLGRSIMLFKRYNIPSIWLRACTKLSSPLLFLSLSVFLCINIIFFSHSFCHSTPSPRVCTNTQTSIPLWNYICCSVILFSVCLW